MRYFTYNSTIHYQKSRHRIISQVNDSHSSTNDKEAIGEAETKTNHSTAGTLVQTCFLMNTQFGLCRRCRQKLLSPPSEAMSAAQSLPFIKNDRNG
jgi:hypothetical protein